MTNEQLVVRIKAGIDVSDNMLQLWQQMKGFIHAVAMHYRGVADTDDLEQEGYLALYGAVEGYNAEQGCKFITYAKYWIQQRMIRYIQKDKPVRIPAGKQADILRYKKFVNAFLISQGREPTNYEASVLLRMPREYVPELKSAARAGRVKSMDEPVDPSDEEASALYELVPGDGNMEDDIIEQLDYEQMKRTLWQCVDSLEGKQPHIMHLVYESGMTREAAGEKAGISCNAVRLQEQKALRKLRHGKNARMLELYYESYIKAHAYDRGAEWNSTTERLALELMEMEAKYMTRV